MFISILLAVTLASIAICHLVAKQRGLKPVFWGMMGLVFGPLAIPFVIFTKPKITTDD